jgi:superfamily II DNA/RNA helicase
MQLRPQLLEGVLAYGFEKVPVLQQYVVPPAIQGLDLVVQAQSGTGKSAAYVMAVLQQLDLTAPAQCQAIVLVPWRELSNSLCKCFTSMADCMQSPPVQVTSLGDSGGLPITREMQQIQHHIVVATPGESCHFQRVTCHLSLGNIHCLLAN